MTYLPIWALSGPSLDALHRERRWRISQPKEGRGCGAQPWTCGDRPWLMTRIFLAWTESSFSLSPKWPLPLGNVIASLAKLKQIHYWVWKMRQPDGEAASFTWDSQGVSSTEGHGGGRRCWSPGCPPYLPAQVLALMGPDPVPPGGWDAKCCRHPSLTGIPAWHLVSNLWAKWLSLLQEWLVMYSFA